MNLSDAEMRALVRLGYFIALMDMGRKVDPTAAKNGRFRDGIPIERLSAILQHVPPDAIRDELVASGLRADRGRLP